MESQAMLQAGFGLVAIAVLSLMVVWKRKRAALMAPQAAGRWPLIGHMPLLAWKRQPIMRTLGALADKYGSAFTIWIGVHRTMVISTSDLAMECFTTHDKILATRPKTTAGKYQGSDYALFAFSAYGNYWRDVRKTVVSNLLSSQQLEAIKNVRVGEIDFCVKDLHRRWTENGAAAPVKVDMKDFFNDLVLNNIAKVLCGKRYFGTANVDDAKEAEKFHTVIRRLFYLGGLILLSDAVPHLEWIDLGGHIAAMKKNVEELDEILSSWVEEHKQRRLAGDKTRTPDFIDAMLTARETIQFPDYDQDTVLKANFRGILLAGSDTTFITLTWALSLLLNAPEKLQRARAEIDGQVGKDRNVDLSDVKNLPYLQAIVKETLRLYPAAPLSVLHQATEDCYIGGYYVPVGTRILTNLWKIQRDPRNWDEPDAFRPERFLAEDRANVDLKGKHFELIPFGSGRRMCPGASFALEVVHLTLARVLHGFDLAKCCKGPVDLTEGLGVTLLKETPVEVFLNPRLPSELYK
ncbi:hypothetical protein H6P81_020954 [Aristolochia fimbriata]|uniref:Cytochrome P450 n=1 Tax=Aristolochia fimbriata TaxID=158543 RepID=A0AAV7DWY7_ARIFI|nr:hypothetical protein H6P81_020954 [Aristolochia fimbriata]